MTRMALVVSVALATVVTVGPMSAAGPSFAGTRPFGGSSHRTGGVAAGGGGFAVRTPIVGSRPTVVDPWKIWGARNTPRPFPGHRFQGGPFFSPSVVPYGGGSSVTTYIVSPPIDTSAAIVYAAPPPASVYPETPAPIPSVVDYPTGRYELRGDGIATPYVWVWIPKPPPAPPLEAPPSVPPPSGALPDPAPRAGADDRAPASRAGTFYRWTDESGVTTLTDRLSKVPERFRAQAQSEASAR
jgi:hypothetical protein